MTRPRLPYLLSAFILIGLLLTGLSYCGRDDKPDIAFSTIEQGLLDTRRQLEKENLLILNRIEMEAAAYPRETSKRFLRHASQLLRFTKDYCLFIDTLKNRLRHARGDTARHNRWFGFTAAPGKLLSAGEPERASPAIGLDRKTQFLRTLIDSIVAGYPDVLDNIPLQFDYFGNGRFQINGYQSSFSELPLSGILAVLCDLQTRASASAFTGLNHCLKKTGGWHWGCIDNFFPVASAKQTNVPLGFNYEADIFLSPYCLDVLSWEVWIDGIPAPVREGRAHYEVITRSVGTKWFVINALIRKINREVTPMRIDTVHVIKEFSYEVGCVQPQIRIDAQYLYVGADNPFTIVPRCGLAPNAVNVKAGNAIIKRTGPGQFSIHPIRPGKVILNVHIGMGLGPSVYEFTARPLPDPVPMLGDGRRGGRVTPEEMSGQTSLVVRYPEDFDFQVDCDIESFQLTRIRPREDMEEVRNKGGDFKDAAKQLLATARPGDRLLFHGITARIPGDTVPRTIGAIVFRVE